MFRRVSLIVTAALAALTGLTGLTGLVTPTADAAGSSYVALGDSYSSGVGTGSYIDDGTSCQRSVYAYPSLISSARGYDLNFRACSGARVSDVTSNQLSALSGSTTYVSISVGGNDAGFADVLTECAQPGWMSDCNGAVDGAQSYINDTLPGSLSALYSDIRSRAPSATVAVVGYPRIFNGEDCNAATWFSPEEETRLNQTADLLNDTLTAAASAHGFSFANPTSSFIGHAVCGDPEWLNGLSSPITESYHPNRTGHASGYTPLVSPKLIGAAVRVTPATVATAVASADRLAAQQSRYAAADRRIKPEEFVLPDLHSPRALAAARKAGVDVDDRISVDRADRRYSAAQERTRAARP